MEEQSILKVLIADDEPEILEIEAKKLRMAGFEVVTATDGNEASMRFSSEEPDIVVLDVSMPGKDGFEVLQEIRSAADQKWVPVIIVTAHGELENMRKGFDLDADHYIHKPCRPEDIVSAVRLMAGLIPLRT